MAIEPPPIKLQVAANALQKTVAVCGQPGLEKFWGATAHGTLSK